MEKYMHRKVLIYLMAVVYRVTHAKSYALLEEDNIGELQLSLSNLRWTEIRPSISSLLVLEKGEVVGEIYKNRSTGEAPASSDDEMMDMLYRRELKRHIPVCT